MNLDSLIPMMLTVMGALLGISATYLFRGAKTPPPTAEHPRRTLSASHLVLSTFAVIVVLFGGVTLIRYLPIIRQNPDSSYFTIWLFLTMVFGMFVQVLTSNYRLGKPMLEISAAQLVFPLLFSILVFYPIWAMASSGTQNFFAIHAAFLNGFFWESIVSSTKSPASSPATGSAQQAER